MDIQELSYFIKNYAMNDMTNSAIMLTGAWGSGKSYYAKEILASNLKEKKDEEDKEIECVIVSLYGITEVSDISKSIYIDLRFKQSTDDKKNETMESAKFILKSFLQIKYNTDIDDILNNKKLDNIYQSIDLNDKLIIIEDLERCTIDIVEVLGYINSLVEQDGIKILIVANEDEIVKPIDAPIKPKKDNTNEKDENKEYEIKLEEYIRINQKHTEFVSRYLRIKEKTISDTIKFEPNLKDVFDNIVGNLNEYKDESKRTLSTKVLKDVVKSINKDLLTSLYKENKQGSIIVNANLRTFIFACQKTLDIYEKFDESQNYSDEYKQFIFISVLRLSIKIKKGDKLNLPDINNYTKDKYALEYPVFEFVYEYVINQKTFDETDISKYYQEYIDYLLKNENTIGNKNLDVLFNITWNYKETVQKSIVNIEHMLEEQKIQYTVYIKLVESLIEAKHIINADIENCKTHMVNNLKNPKVTPDVENLFNFDRYKMKQELYDKLDEKLKDYYNDFIKQIKDALKGIKPRYFDFYSDEEKAVNFHNRSDIGRMMIQKTFSHEIDVDDFCNTIINQSPKTIAYVNYTFEYIYNRVSFNNTSAYRYLVSDKDTISEIIEFLSPKIENCDSIDNIQKYNLNEFIETLKEIKQRYETETIE